MSGLSDIFNLNFISFGAITASVFTATVGIYLFSIPKKSKATLNLALAYLFITGLTVAYSIAFIIYHPIAAYHRWLSVWAVLPSVLYLGQFFFFFPDERRTRAAKAFLIVQWAVVIFISVYWPLHTFMGENIIFRPDGQYFDFDEEAVSGRIAQVILIYILIVIGLGTWRSIVSRGMKRIPVIGITLSLAVVTILPGLGNYLIRTGAWTRDFFHVVFDLCIVFGWFITGILYMNLTRDRTSFMAKISGVGFSTLLVVLLFTSYYTLKDREESYNLFHQNQIPRMLADTTYRPVDLEYLTANPQNGTAPDFIYKKSGVSVSFCTRCEGDLHYITADTAAVKHYNAFTHYDSRTQTVYEAGFSYLLYRRFIHIAAFKFLIILLVVSVITIVGFRIFLSGTLLMPLRALIRGLTKVGEGNLDISIPIKLEDEIGFLTKSFNSMVDSVKRATIERDVAEWALRSTEAKFRGLVEQSLTGIYIVRERKIYYANPKFAEIFGYTQDEALALDSIMDIAADEDRGLVSENLRKRETKEVEYLTYTFTGKKKDGSRIDIEVFGTSMDINDKPAVIGTLMDITERKQSHEAIAREKERLTVTLSSIGDGVIATDTEGRILLMNKAAENLTGWSFEEAKGKYFEEVIILFDKENHHGISSPVKEMLRSSGLTHGTMVPDQILRSRNRGERIVSQVYSPLLDSNNRIFGVVVALHDITYESATREELMRIRSFLKNILDSMQSALVSVDRDGRILHWNSEAERITGVPEPKAIGQPLDGLYPLMKEHMEHIFQAIKERKSHFIEKYMFASGSDIQYCDIMVYPLAANGVEGAVIRVDNITERIRLEEMMVQTEKMLTLGGLTAGMAHEINNPLGSILMSAQNIQRRLSPDMAKNIEAAQKCDVSLDRINHYLEQRGISKMIGAILEMGDRASKIVADMLTFSRRSETKKEPRDIPHIIDKAIDLACHDYDLKKQYDFRRIEISREYDADLPLIKCSETEIEQVLLNLFKNAAHAMAEKEYLDEKPQLTLGLKRQQDILKVIVRDNGPGIDKNTLGRIFEPFFTTKKVGIGTGLGLSVSYHIIVNNHNGEMRAESEKGKGTTFIIQLPIYDTT